MTAIERPEPGDVDDVVSLWVELAEGQRKFGSHLHAAENRDVIQSQISRSLVTGELLVARIDEHDEREGDGGGSDGEDNDGGDGDDGNGDVGEEDARGGNAEAGETGDVVGFVMFGPESGSYQQDVDRGTVHNIYVREPYRGEGIGTDLLDAAEAALADVGVEVISIGVMAANDGARRLYRRRGYGPHRVELEKETETTNQSSENG